jgi:hypothetical protein
LTITGGRKDNAHGGRKRKKLVRSISLGAIGVSRIVCGGNPFSGFSHQGAAKDREMRRFYTVARIKEALRLAEAAGIDTLFARSDNFVIRLLEEYWDEGGRIQWVAQTASELGDQIGAVRAAAACGAIGVYIHGGMVDHWFAQRKTGLLADALKAMRDSGVAAGFAGHAVEAHAWIRDHLDPDFQMCSYYDPSPRADSPHHVARDDEKWDPAHRERMAALIRTIRKPVVHYKVFAGGNRPVDEGFRFLARTMRPGDAVCIGFYVKDRPGLFAENVAAFDRLVERAGQA